MNRINTGLISDPNIEQGFTGQSLSFVQNAYTDMLLGIAQSVIGESYDSTKAYILKGLDAYGTNQYHPGYVLYAGEIFACGGKLTTTAFSFVPVLNIVVTPDSVADPCPFSDGTPRPVHDNRNIVLSDAASGTILLSAVIYVQSLIIFTIGVSPAPSYAGTWTSGGGAGFGGIRYWKDKSGMVHIQGAAHGGGADLVTTLPAGYRPSTKLLFCTIDQTTITAQFIQIETDGKISVIGATGNDYSFIASFPTT